MITTETYLKTEIKKEKTRSAAPTKHESKFDNISLLCQPNAHPYRLRPPSLWVWPCAPDPFSL